MKTNKAMFLEKYQIDFKDEVTIDSAYARDLFVALKRISKEYGLTFGMSSVQQFAQRFSNDMDTIRQAGFDITVERPNGSTNRTATYRVTLRRNPDSATVSDG